MSQGIRKKKESLHNVINRKKSSRKLARTLFLASKIKCPNMLSVGSCWLGK